ncbi:MAG: General stress protein 26 [Chloroflexi bacterium]|jgi:general stress protein 26|nr:MAG: General stress protein 26 [Chloroflexota bacterium]|tara:strand:+ start:15389 stop:15922 length:534 start_codon:yes stop_codon:yes gene_type:complete
MKDHWSNKMGEVWNKEKKIDDNESEQYRDIIREFISKYHSTTLSYFLTIRKNGQPVMRPVSTFVEGWDIYTISQHHQVKVQHVKNNANVGYLFTDNEGDAYMPLGYTKNVWVSGICEIITDQSEIEEFFIRREKGTGQGDAHPHDNTYTRLLFKTKLNYLRAEGFAEHARPIIYKHF